MSQKGFQNIKRQLEELKIQSRKEQSAIEPLRREVEKLMRENNDLHFEMIKTKERVDMDEVKWESSLRSMEDQKKDLKYLIDQKDLKINTVNKQNEQLRIKIEELLSKLYLPSKATNLDSAPKEYLDEVFSKPHNKISTPFVTLRHGGASKFAAYGGSHKRPRRF